MRPHLNIKSCCLSAESKHHAPAERRFVAHLLKNCCAKLGHLAVIPLTGAAHAISGTELRSRCMGKYHLYVRTGNPAALGYQPGQYQLCVSLHLNCMRSPAPGAKTGTPSHRPRVSSTVSIGMSACQHGLAYRNSMHCLGIGLQTAATVWVVACQLRCGRARAKIL